MIVTNHIHDLKIKIYNTKCSMDIGAKGNNPEKKFEHLGDFTAAEYFARRMIPEFVTNLSNNLNIRELNETCRKLAFLGKQNKEKSSNVCIYCEKVNKDNNIWKCIECSRKIHQKCAPKYFVDKGELAEILNDPEQFCCDQCGYGSPTVKSLTKEQNVGFLKSLDYIDQLLEKETEDLVEAIDDVLTLEEVVDVQ